MIFLGAMSGSSLDGIDLALVEFDAQEELKWRFLATTTCGYSKEWQHLLKSAPDLSARELYHLEAKYSHAVAEYIGTFIAAQSIKPDYIGWHGHTIYHDPDLQTSCQIGHGATLSAQTGIPTVCDFRSIDLALGGQGAPLAPIVESDLMSNYEYYANFGGICNISHHDKVISSADVVACNQLLNYVAGKVDLPYDDNGDLAQSGIVIPSLLHLLNDDPYFDLHAPKSIDNNWITSHQLPLIDRFDSPTDALATIVAHITQQVTNYLTKSAGGSGRMLATGGGAHNAFLMQRIGEAIEKHSIQLEIADEVLIDFKEALLMAYMAYCYINRHRNVLSDVTGSRQDHVGGCLYYGC